MLLLLPSEPRARITSDSTAVMSDAGAVVPDLRVVVGSRGRRSLVRWGLHHLQRVIGDVAKQLREALVHLMPGYEQQGTGMKHGQ